MNRFRTLRADEIDVRVSQVKDGEKPGVILLLYKDARCDQNILDETVGPMNWQRHHSRENANCIVSIWDEHKGQWIEKEDTGKESRTESEKGLASDSFKRACFNWGIGRELYTAPFIFVPAAMCNIKNGKCYDNFTVETIEYQPDGQREIRHLVIRNEAKKSICYQWKIGERKAAEETGEQNQAAVKPPKDETRVAVVRALITAHGITNGEFNQMYSAHVRNVWKMSVNPSLTSLTDEQFENVIMAINDELNKRETA